jgi:hypothetical protein
MGWPKVAYAVPAAVKSPGAPASADALFQELAVEELSA